jgi:hypothetical protein
MGDSGVFLKNAGNVCVYYLIEKSDFSKKSDFLALFKSNDGPQACLIEKSDFSKKSDFLDPLSSVQSDLRAIKYFGCFQIKLWPSIASNINTFCRVLIRLSA